LVLYKVIKNVFFESAVLQLTVFVLVALTFILFEKLQKGKLEGGINDLNYKKALAIGLAQALAVVPGVSRAGAVIVPLIALGIRREEAAKYSFLLAVPTMFAASTLDLFKSRGVLVGQTGNIGLLAVGFFVSFVCATAVVKWFVSYLTKHDLAIFGWYRLALVATLLIIGLTL
jgi:undecaprenyl-diphosphatase